MTRHRAAAILPSRNEGDTISTVTTTIDAALDDPGAVLLHADSSESPATASQFRTTATAPAAAAWERNPDPAGPGQTTSVPRT